jgi:signal transduction histidine kinase
MTFQIIAFPLRSEHDLVAARKHAREIGARLGFGAQDQIRIATTVSEIARNALLYAKDGSVSFAVTLDPPEPALVVQIADKGPGIPHLGAVLSGQYRSTTGMGLGLTGAQRLMDGCDIDTAPERGTTVTLTKLLPPNVRSVDAKLVNAIAEQLARIDVGSGLEELQQQNSELVATLAALRERQEELTRLARELEDTNRGVVALYAELEDQAAVLRRADEMKSRFLSNMSHEFRTPLSSIRALSKLLLSQVDGPLSPEQQHQVGFIIGAANDLTDLVNDLLDLAKIEAGKVDVRPSEFEIAALFSTLRGMMKPLATSDRVELVFEEPVDVTRVVGDEAKIAQILRNFISNALKFTPAGEVRVGCRQLPDRPGMFELWVRDTGIGLAPEHLSLIFEEFSQVEHELQRIAKGSGLGLPLCQKLGALLGGSIHVESQPGLGSRFSVVLPLETQVATSEAQTAGASPEFASSAAAPSLQAPKSKRAP